MGRGGKKKDKKKDDVPSLAGFTIDEPSTSQARPEPKPAETKQKKIETAQKSKESTPAPETKQEDDGLGLGGGARKRNPRKKKSMASIAAAEAAVSPATPVVAPSSVVQRQAQPLQSPQTDFPVVGSWGSRPSFQDIRRGQGEPAFGQGAQSPPGPQSPPSGQFSPGPPSFQRSPGFQGAPGAQGPARDQGHQMSAGRGRGQAPHVQPKTRVSESERQPGDSKTLCRFKIPGKIEGRSVPAQMIRVYTNYLQMQFKDLTIARYDVSFKPEVKKLVPRVFEAVKAKHFARSLIAFDQAKNCYTLKPLPGVGETERFSTTVEIVDNNSRALTFEVSFKFTGMVNLSRIKQYMNSGGTSLSPPSEAIQCIDVILRQGALESYVKAGRQFFKRPSNPIDLSGGLEMWTGLFQSAIFTSKAFINIDVAHKGFPKYQPLIVTLTRDFQLDPTTALDNQNRRNLELFQQFLKGLRVIATVGGDAKGQKREFICNNIVKPASVITFELVEPDGRKERMTVADFFGKKKGCRLRYPHLNCVWVGSRDKSIYYPMELLHVSFGQALNKQLNENQLRTMVMKAATPPGERKQKIVEIIKDMNYSNNNYFKEFGLDIANEFYEVEARVLKPPDLEVGPGGRMITPRRGEWRQQGLLKAQPLQSWGIIAVDVYADSCDFQTIIPMIVSVGKRMGMNASDPIIRRTDVTMRSLAHALDDASRRGLKLLFVIVGTRSRDLYHKVKQIAEREVGILTQCIKENTASRRVNEQTIQNILLKVNSKLMGINQAISERALPRCLQGGGVMVVGADVTHPSPDQSQIPSIAAVTASIDAKCYIYNIELSIQTPKKEMIVQFEDMMVAHLKVYQQQMRALPRKIFVFRDGVSEGQFAEVMNSELQAVHNAYYRMTGKPNKPEVLFLLVQKRHHTRLFQKNNPNQNVEPGTVVDKDIVHASELDFYLVSHQAIKGTARPTRYHAVCNDGDIRHDEVEQLTFYLCHLFSRCTRSVSYPTPTYYAHLACLRARSLTHGETFDNDELERSPRRLCVLENIWRVSPMFFV